MGSSKSKSTSKKSTTTAKKVVTTKAKVTAKAAAPKRAKTSAKPAVTPAEQVELLETVETVVSVEATPQGALVETTETTRVETAEAATQVEVKSQRVMPWNEVEQLVRQEAFRLAQRRHFRDGTPEQDWFAAEAAVKAQLQARGITLAN